MVLQCIEESLANDVPADGSDPADMVREAGGLCGHIVGQYMQLNKLGEGADMFTSSGLPMRAVSFDGERTCVPPSHEVGGGVQLSNSLQSAVKWVVLGEGREG